MAPADPALTHARLPAPTRSPSPARSDYYHAPRAITAQGGSAAHAGVDVSDAESVAGLGRAVSRTFGRLHFAFNNAGVNTLAGRVTIDQYPRAEWDRILAVDIHPELPQLKSIRLQRRLQTILPVEQELSDI